MNLLIIVHMALWATFAGCIFAQDQEDGVSGADLKPSACLMVNAYSMNVRNSPCGDETDIASYGRAFRFTGKVESCDLYGGPELVEFVQVYIQRKLAWVASGYVEEAEEEYCRLTDAVDQPGYNPRPRPDSLDGHHQHHHHNYPRPSPFRRHLGTSSRSVGTIDEIMDHWACYLVPDKLGYHDRTNGLFGIMDYNGDGFLTVREFHDFPYHMNLDIGPCQDLITANDMDESGYLDVYEYVDMFLYRNVDCSRL